MNNCGSLQNIHGVPAQRRSVCVLLPHGDYWAAILATKHGHRVEVPGGKVEPGETPEQAAERECREECGITPRGLRAIHRGECCGYDATAFLADSPVEPLGEGDSGVCCWVDRALLVSERSVYPVFLRDVFAAVDASKRVKRAKP